MNQQDMLALSRMNVEDANKKLKAEKGIAADEITDASDMNQHLTGKKHCLNIVQ